MTLLQQTTLIRSDNPGMSFDAAWQQACSMQRVTGSFGRPTKSSDAVLIAEASGLGVHPALKRELNKHGAIEKARTASDTLDHVKRLQRVRELMQRDPSLNWDQAFTQVCKEENAMAPPLKTSQSVAKGNGKLMLIEGAHYNFFIPLPGVNG
jgi:hypothetical protein